MDAQEETKQSQEHNCISAISVKTSDGTQATLAILATYRFEDDKDVFEEKENSLKDYYENAKKTAADNGHVLPNGQVVITQSDYAEGLKKSLDVSEFQFTKDIRDASFSFQSENAPLDLQYFDNYCIKLRDYLRNELKKKYNGNEYPKLVEFNIDVKDEQHNKIFDRNTTELIPEKTSTETESSEGHYKRESLLEETFRQTKNKIKNKIMDKLLTVAIFVVLAAIVTLYFFLK